MNESIAARDVVDSLPANIAVIGPDARIVAVNQGWRRFGADNGNPALREAREGDDYLATVRRAVESGCAGALAALTGIEEVLAGGRPSFELEYACHSPGAQRWFQMTATPLSGGRGAVVAHVDITRRRLAEDAAHAAGHHWSLVRSTANIATWDWDLATGSASCSENMGPLYGIAASTQAPAFPEWLAIIHPEDRERVRAEVADSLEARRDLDIEFRVVWPDGTVRWLLAKAQAIHDASGKPYRLAGINMDITARKQAEEAVRESEARFRTLAREAPVGIFLTGPTGETVFANPAYCAILGLRLEDALGFGCAGAIHPADRQRVLRVWSEAVSTRTPFALDYRYGHDDRTVWVSAQASPLRDGAGNFAGMVGSVADTTERVKAQEALEVSEQRFATFLGHAPVLAFLKNMRGRIMYFTPMFGTMAGLPCGVWLDESSHLDPASLSAWREQDRLVESTRREHTFEDSFSVDGQQRHYRTVKFPIFDRDGTLVSVGGITVDVTDRKQAEDELRALAGGLLAFQDNERRRISRELHDDFTQRLAALTIDLERLSTHLPESRRQLRAQLAALHARSAQACDDVRQLAYRLHPSLLDHLGLEVALRSHCESFAAREGIAVDFRASLDSPLDAEAASCLYRVTQEALHNVARHAGARNAKVEIAPRGAAVELRIEDDGKGFQPGAAPGRLGIIGMRERVRGAGGTFTLESRPGAGTRIEVRLPRRSDR